MEERSQNRHLTPWRPGESGNRKGRPKGKKSLTQLLREALEKTRLCYQDLPEGKTAAELLTEAIIHHAIAGNASYAKEILERLDGKTPDAEPRRDDSRRSAVDIIRESLKPAEDS